MHRQPLLPASPTSETAGAAWPWPAPPEALLALAADCGLDNGRAVAPRAHGTNRRPAVAVRPGAGAGRGGGHHRAQAHRTNLARGAGGSDGDAARPAGPDVRSRPRGHLPPRPRSPAGVAAGAAGRHRRPQPARPAATGDPARGRAERAGVLRRVDRAAQPPAAAGPHRANTAAPGTRAVVVRTAVHRPGRFQTGQRSPRPRRRRPGADRGGAAFARQRARDGPPGAVGRRRVCRLAA